MTVNQCPECGLPLSEDPSDRHCTSPSCPWIRCTCYEVIDPRNGHHKKLG